MSSSFIVCDTTINRIVTWFDQNEKVDSPYRLAVAEALSIDPAHPNFSLLLGRALFAMNVSAVVRRYGPAEPARVRRLEYEYRPELPGGDAQVYRALCCLLYQSCEGDVPETKLFQALTTVRLKIAHGIIAETAEYQKAEWA
ncbi:MAG: hypothetical protein WCA00_15755 [Candidatus Acidiferrales bacterium]